MIVYIFQDLRTSQDIYRMEFPDTSSVEEREKDCYQKAAEISAEFLIPPEEIYYSRLPEEPKTV